VSIAIAPTHTQAVRDGVKAEVTAFSSGQLTASLLGGLFASGQDQAAEDQVNQWTVSRCGGPPDGSLTA
jgi:hypothetical protein